MALSNYTIETFSSDGITHDVYHRGEGPGVVVMAEMPGITPAVVSFADAVVDRGMSVAMPSMFGTPGAASSTFRAVRTMIPACVRKEFAGFALKADRPATKWLTAVARDLHQRAGGPGVGAVGMCFTGGFGLAMMVDPSVVAPVLSQPSLPIGRKGRADIGLSDASLSIVKDRVAQGCEVMGLRFTSDPFVRDERFESLRQELGDGFIAVEIESPDDTWDISSRAHSVITEEVRPAQPDHPATKALAQVLDFLDDKLLNPAT